MNLRFQQQKSSRSVSKYMETFKEKNLRQLRIKVLPIEEVLDVHRSGLLDQKIERRRVMVTNDSKIVIIFTAEIVRPNRQKSFSFR